MYKVENEDPNIIARFCEPEEAFSKYGKRLPNSDEILKYCEKIGAQLNKKMPMTKRLRKLRKLADEIANDLGNGKAVCQKGCAHCCKKDVDVGIFEAIDIANKYELTAVQREKRVRSGYSGYCPFLNQDDATCKIYHHRPLQCRLFMSLDSPDYCIDPSQQHAVLHLKHTLFAGFYDVFMASGNNVKADIREWFAEYTIAPYKGIYERNVTINDREADAVLTVNQSQRIPVK